MIPFVQISKAGCQKSESGYAWGDGGDGAGEWRDLWRHETCSVS